MEGASPDMTIVVDWEVKHQFIKKQGKSLHRRLSVLRHFYDNAVPVKFIPTHVHVMTYTQFHLFNTLNDKSRQ